MLKCGRQLRLILCHVLLLHFIEFYRLKRDRSPQVAKPESAYHALEVRNSVLILSLSCNNYYATMFSHLTSVLQGEPRGRAFQFFETDI